MGTAIHILSGTDAQVAKAVKKLADRTMGAGGRDADAKAGRELVALFQAAQKAGDARVVGTLAGDKDLQDIIFYAAEHGPAEFVGALLDAGVSPSLAVFGNMRPIYVAAKAGREAIVELLVRAGESPSYDGFIKPVLVHAIEDGHLGVAALLVRLGADVTRRLALGGSTPLIEAAAAAAAASADSTSAAGSLVRLMLERGADANDPDDDGRTPLMAAAGAGNLDAVRALVDAGADVNAAARLRTLEAIDAERRGESMFSDKFWRRMRAKQADPLLTALMLAAGNGHADVVEALLAAGADRDAKDARGRTALDYAESNAHATVLRVLTGSGGSGGSGGGGGAVGEPAVGVRDLIDAAERGDLPRVEQLLASGAIGDLNAKPAVRYGKANPDGEVEQTGGRPALVAAAASGRAAVVERLIAAGADVNARGDATVFENGQSPLHAAAEHGHAAVARLLLDAGADVGAKEAGRPQNFPPRTAMQIAAAHKRKAVVNELLRARSADGAVAAAAAAPPRQASEPTRKKNSKARAKGKSKVTGLHEAAENGDAQLVRRLLEAGADVDALATGTRWSPLMYAAFMGYAEIAKVLLDAGADVNLANRAGQVALTVAIHGATMAPDVRPNAKPPRSYAKTMRLLLARGADVTVNTWDGETALDMANQKRLPALVKILQDAKGKGRLVSR